MVQSVGGVQRPTRNESVSIGTSNVQVCAPRIQQLPRTAYVIRNISDDPTKIITVVLGDQVATNNVGIVLRQYESFSDSDETGYLCHQGTINAICAVAGGTLAIMER